jgi:glutaredoxin
LWGFDVFQAKEPARTRVTFYTKAGCHLCDEARDMLDDIAAQATYELTEIDIRSDPQVFEQYRYRIPVILIASAGIVGGQGSRKSDTQLEGRIEYRDLAEAFELD